jgi:hypothetical protein
MALIIIDGDNMAKRVKKTDGPVLARAAGVNLMQITYIDDLHPNPPTIRGFQGVRIRKTEIQGRPKLIATLSKDEQTGESCSSLRPLEFTPNEITGVMESYIPDTEFNRHKLAGMFYHSNLCNIIDDAIRAEIKEMADEIEKTLVVVPSDKEKLTATEEENKKLREMLLKSEQEKQALIINSSPAKTETLTENTDNNSTVVDSTTVLNAVKTVPQASARERAKEQIYLNKGNIVKKLKNKHGDNWAKSPGHKKELLPLINALEKELKDADNSGTGIAS